MLVKRRVIAGGALDAKGLIGLLLGFASITFLMCDFMQQEAQYLCFSFLQRMHSGRLHEAAALCCPQQAVLLCCQ